MNPVGTSRKLGLLAAGSVVAIAAALASGLWSGNALAQLSRADTALGYTKAFEELKLPFSAPGVVKKEHVEEGDTIKTGQLLLSQDDEVEQKELERLQLAANSNARIEAAEADLRAKTAKYERVKGIFDAGGGNKSEVEEAEAEMILGQKQLVVSKEDKQDAIIKAEKQAKQLDRMKINSPFDGIVEKIVVHGGEWFDPQKGEGAIVVVKNDPLYIEVRDLNVRQVAMLKLGQKLKVRYPDQADKPENWQDAEIVFFSPVAESGSQTRLFKLKMPNTQGRESGLELVVKLPENVAAAAVPVFGETGTVAGK